MPKHGPLLPFLTALLAIAVLTLMDVFMKSAAIVVGAFSTLLWRHALAFALSAPAYGLTRRNWPAAATIRLHLLRSVAITFTSLTFFTAITILPLAEAIAISFISPLVALALAALILKEQIRRSAIWAAILGLAGVGVIVSGRLGNTQMADDHALFGIGLVLISAVGYAWNLILQRQQSLRAQPLEIAAFQSLFNCAILLPAAPFLLQMPAMGTWTNIAVAAVLGVAGGLLLSWAYARAEAQVLVPVEYTGFVWAALFGWLLLDEAVEIATVAGTVLIVAGCWIAAPRGRPEPSSV